MKIEVKTNDLILMLNAVKHAMAIKDIRYYLNGVRLEVEDVKVRLIATDGHRLAVCEAFLDPGLHSLPMAKAAFTFNADSVAPMLTWLKTQTTKSGKLCVSLEYEPREQVYKDPDGRDGTAAALPGDLTLIGPFGHIAYKVRPHDETYPDWRRVHNPGLKDSLHSSGAFNGEYLADVAKVAKLFNAKFGGIRLQMGAGLAVLTCSNADGIEFSETLMGTRV